ncbi:DNA cytosine methyltransferase [Consotaella aegiceratis]|uniref:DNA cytosine methyltransferase n=1 Tax=Consotaella aegiceratis TaxID=3097961 RepID=UPI002F4049AA
MLVADLLCGAGGSSTGAKRALDELGLDMELVCVNHWPTAIDTHRLNHPEARHYVQDIATVRPHLLVPEGYLDLLMASPTCTHHSVARGGKPTSDQQRSDPWHIVTWLTELRVKRIIIENVWEFIGWGPVDRRTGKPVKSRKGEYFHAWIETLKRLGFDLEWRKLNAADYGDATTRSRFILMGRSDGRKVSWPMPTHRRRGSADMFGGMQPWRPAREVIDWSIKGRSIFSRKKPLAPKTLARIYAGAVKLNWPDPFIVILRNHMAAQGIDMPLPTIAANGTHIGIAEPVIMNGRKGNQPLPVSGSPIPTLDTKGGVWLAEPMVLSQHNSGAARPANDPLPTITTGGAGSDKREGCARPMLVEPFVLSAAHGVGADEVAPHTRRCRSVDEPLGTIHAGGGNFGVVEPFVLSQASGGSPRPVSAPLPTATTGGAGGAHALISPYYGSGSGETCTSTDEPLPTVTAKGRFGMIVPVTHGAGGHRARDIETEGLPTITGANRGELAFITAQHGERQDQAPRKHGLDNPLPTIAASGHVDLVEPGPKFDILFRMLEPHELAAAMGFNTTEVSYEFAGTKTDQIKQIGNAVSVAKMKACVRAIMADAAPEASSLPVEFREAAE